MQYKTITLELIREQPELYERLRSSKRLLPSMDANATELKASHESWKESLHRRYPGSDPGQVASEALEPAIEFLRELLHSASSRDGAGLTADAARGLRPAMLSE